MKVLLFTMLVFASLWSKGQGADETAIRNLLARQTAEWNKGNVEGFMQTYWKSDSLLFIGKSGVNHGWQRTLNNYKRNYPDTTAMGKLAFDVLEIRPLSPEYYYVVGKWMLHRTIGDLSGHFDLLLRKIGGRWVIVADHSS